MGQGLNRSVSRYYEEISRAPRVDPDQERKLIYRWQRKKDVTARDAIVNTHLRFVIKLAHRHTRNPNKIQDLIAAGNLGLLRAVDKYDLTRPTRFLTYATWWIQEEMFKEEYGTSTLVHVPTHRQKAQRKKARNYQRALAEHGQTKAVQQMDPGLPEGTTVPVDALNDAVEEDEGRTPFSCETEDARRRLRRAVARLPPREQTVLNLYFGTKDEPRNLVRIAAMMDMSPERVRQLKINGMQQLRETLPTPDAY